MPPSPSMRIYYPDGAWSSWGVNDEFSTPITETGSASDLGDLNNATFLNLPAFSISSVNGLLIPKWSTAEERFQAKSATIYRLGYWELTVVAKASASQPGPLVASIQITNLSDSPVATIEEDWIVDATSYTTYTATGSVASWPNIVKATEFTLSIDSSTFEDIQVAELNFSIPVLVYPLVEMNDWSQSGLMMIE